MLRAAIHSVCMRVQRVTVFKPEGAPNPCGRTGPQNTVCNAITVNPTGLLLPHTGRFSSLTLRFLLSPLNSVKPTSRFQRAVNNANCQVLFSLCKFCITLCKYAHTSSTLQHGPFSKALWFNWEELRLFIQNQCEPLFCCLEAKMLSITTLR